MSVWKSDEKLLSICILNFSFKNDFVLLVLLLFQTLALVFDLLHETLRLMFDILRQPLVCKFKYCYKVTDVK